MKLQWAMQPAKKERVMKFFTWISMKSQMGHAWRRRIFMHWHACIHAYVCGRFDTLSTLKRQSNGMNFWCFMCQEHLIPFSSLCCIESIAALLHRSCKCRIIYYLNISYGCSKSRDTRVWLRPPRIQVVTYSTYKRHCESFNAETRTHIKQIFPFIPRISAGCLLQNTRGTMLSDFLSYTSFCV